MSRHSRSQNQITLEKVRKTVATWMKKHKHLLPPECTQEIEKRKKATGEWKVKLRSKNGILGTLRVSENTHTIRGDEKILSDLKLMAA